MFPSNAARIAVSSGAGRRCNSVVSATAKPGAQYPHWNDTSATSASRTIRPSGRAPSASGETMSAPSSCHAMTRQALTVIT
jgi:hypothetical protein